MLIPCSNPGCGRLFEVTRKRNHKYCPECSLKFGQATLQKKLQKLARKRRSHPKLVVDQQKLHVNSLGDMPAAEVARILGLTQNAVCRIERQALDKLRRTKGLSVLRQYWRAYLHQGRPKGDLPEAVDADERLLEYQLQMSEFYQYYDKLVGTGKTEAALKCLTLIENCNKLIRREIGLESPLNLGDRRDACPTP